jgi:ABC-2 type transport system permease protein
VFLGLFGPLLATTTGQPIEATLQVLVPGIIVMSCLMGTSMTGSNLIAEFHSGSHERLLVTPLSRPALLIGRALKEIVPVLVQAVIVIAMVLPFGFRFDIAGALIGMVLIALFSVGLGALSYALALAVRAQDWVFWLVQQTVLFPLLLLAGVLLPLDGGPEWLRTAAAVNPLRYLVDAERALFAGDLTSMSVPAGLVAAIVTVGIGLGVGTRAMRKAN